MSAIGTKRTFLVALHMSAFGGKADMACALHTSAYDPKRTWSGDLGLPIRICQGGILNRNGRWRVPLPQVEHTHSGNHCHNEDNHTRR